jgi:hypothetical protein
VSFLKSGISAVGRLLIIVALLGTFLLGLFGVVIFSLRGEEIKVPEIIGKDFDSSEKELAALGLKIKKRATRYSQEAPNTVLEQLPKPGETVKTGQLILVVISRSYTEGDEQPIEVEKETNEAQPDIANDNEPVNTALTKKDKPKKEVKANSNTNANKATANANTAGTGENKDSEAGNNNGGVKNSNTANPNNKNNNRSTPAGNTAKPVPAKPPAATGDTRPRRNP